MRVGIVAVHVRRQQQPNTQQGHQTEDQREHDLKEPRSALRHHHSQHNDVEQNQYGSGDKERENQLLLVQLQFQLFHMYVRSFPGTAARTPPRLFI